MKLTEKCKFKAIETCHRNQYEREVNDLLIAGWILMDAGYFHKDKHVDCGWWAVLIERKL